MKVKDEKAIAHAIRRVILDTPDGRPISVRNIAVSISLEFGFNEDTFLIACGVNEPKKKAATK